MGRGKLGCIGRIHPCFSSSAVQIVLNVAFESLGGHPSSYWLGTSLSMKNMLKKVVVCNQITKTNASHTIKRGEKMAAMLVKSPPD